MAQCYLCENHLEDERVSETAMFIIPGEKSVNVQMKFTDEEGASFRMCHHCLTRTLTKITEGLINDYFDSDNVDTIQ